MKHKSPLILVLLLALMPVWPTHAVDLGELRDSKGLPTPFGRQVLEDFHGKDLKGKDGPLRKLGMDLIVTSHKFKEYQARGGRRHTGRPFKSDNPLLRINQERIVIDAVAAGDVEMLK